MDSNFLRERLASAAQYPENKELVEASERFLLATVHSRYSYNFDWLSRPIIQYPQDIVAMQELIWKVQPDLIIETGIAHGGSLMLSASMLAMIDYCEAVKQGRSLNPLAGRRRVLGIDIEIRPHNRSAIERHPLSHMINMIEGSSIDPSVIERVAATASGHGTILVFLDSNHTHDHVLAELEAYAPLTSPGSYCCVFDTVIEDLPDTSFPDRPWGKGNNPKTAVHEYLRLLTRGSRSAADGQTLEFEIDRQIQDKLLVTVAPDGYLRRVSR